MPVLYISPFIHGDCNTDGEITTARGYSDEITIFMHKAAKVTTIFGNYFQANYHGNVFSNAGNVAQCDNQSQ